MRQGLVYAASLAYAALDLPVLNIPNKSGQHTHKWTETIETTRKRRRKKETNALTDFLMRKQSITGEPGRRNASDFSPSSVGHFVRLRRNATNQRLFRTPSFHDVRTFRLLTQHATFIGPLTPFLFP